MLNYYFLLLLFSISNLYAQNHSKDMILCTNLDGVDTYPAYQANVKNSYIDSIIYDGPLIIFCISLEKTATDEKKIRLESVNSSKSWIGGSSKSGYIKPIKIKNIFINGNLIKNKITINSLDISLKGDEKTKTIKISCQLYFWRHHFKDSDAKILESIDQINPPVNTFKYAFESIRIRKNNFTKPLYSSIIKDFEGNYFLDAKKGLNKEAITLNDTPIESFPLNSIDSEKPYSFKEITYKVDRNNENQLYLEGIVNTENHTIFKLKFYMTSNQYISLNNTFGKRYFIKSEPKTLFMKFIRNIKLNNVLILKELARKETLKFRTSLSPFYITYEIWFDRIPQNFKNINLIEGKAVTGYPFNIYSINIQ